MFERRILIVGGGFSGCLTAIQLLRKRWPFPVTVTIIERVKRFARGLAYGTANSWHYLNVNAGNMSALPEEPDSLLRFLSAADAGISWKSFITREMYGSYLQSLLDEVALEAAKGASGKQNLQLVNDTVISITSYSACHDLANADSHADGHVENSSDGSLDNNLADNFASRTGEGIPTDLRSTRLVCHLGSGRSLPADVVVLALGNNKPGIPSALRHLDEQGRQRLIADPWSRDWNANIGSNDSVFFVGTGLTMVDKVLELAESGHEGKLYALSRHGLLPQSHHESWLFRGSPPVPAGEKLPLSMSVRQTFHEVRRLVKSQSDWRPVIDCLRPHGQLWWQALPLAERKRFGRHLQSYWDVHRHRMAPVVANRLREILDKGQLIIIAGGIETCDVRNGRVDLSLRCRAGAGTLKLSVDEIVNCTGAQTRIDKQGAGNELMASLKAQGWISSNDLCIGLNVSAEMRVIDGNGLAHRNLFALGPPLRGSFFETIAVPELRRQAQLVAEQIFEAQLASGPGVTQRL